MKLQYIICIAFVAMTFTACQSKAMAESEKITEKTESSEATSTSSTSMSTVKIDSVDAYTAATARHSALSFNGVIVTPPQSEATVALTMGGVVRKATLLPGQYVQKGSLLATLENPDFIDLQQNYLESLAQVEYLKEEYNRQKALSDQKAASLKKYQESKAEYLSMQSKLSAAEARLSLLGISGEQLQQNGIQPLLEVKAPISGYLSEININRGKYVQAGEPICEIIDKSAPMLCLTTYEKDLAGIKDGDTVLFRVNGMENKNFQATIISIGQLVDPINRSIKVYARINQNHPQFRPGMYVTAQIDK